MNPFLPIASLVRKDRARSHKGVTLIELLCVLAIIAILLALYLPSVGRVYKRVKTMLTGE